MNKKKMKMPKTRNPLVLSMILNPKRNPGFKSEKKEASRKACRKRVREDS
jgi:hypothetical protein